jgi:hypothetical protein
MPYSRALFPSLSILLVCPAGAQESWFSTSLVQRPEVDRAFAFIDRNQESQLAEWIRITEIPAPSGLEARRADYIESELRKTGLDEVYRDKRGNVIGRLNGSGAGPNLVFAAHFRQGPAHAAGIGRDQAAVPGDEATRAAGLCPRGPVK